jgi:type IV pilus assembly protein PilM
MELSMGLFGVIQSKKLVGVDVGSYALKLIQLKKKGEKFELVALAYEPLPHQSIVDGSIMDSTVISDSIQRVFYESRTKLKNVAFSVSGSSVMVKKIEVENTNPKQLHEDIQWEAKPHIPFDTQEIKMDYEILDSKDPGSNKVSVLLTAVKNEKIAEYSQVFEIAGKTPVLIDVDAFAILNSVSYNYPQVDDKCCAVINIGASVTNILIVKEGVPIFVRDIPMGGNQFTDLIQKELSLKYEKAESVKKGRQIEGVSQAGVKPVVDMILKELKDEIEKTFQFYRSNVTEGRIDLIMLSGGTANLEDLTTLFQNEFEIPVQIANPFNRLEVNPKRFDISYMDEMAPAFNVAVGLALREVGDKK